MLFTNVTIMLGESQITYALSVFRMFVISVRIWLSYCLLIQNGILNVLFHLQLVIYMYMIMINVPIHVYPEFLFERRIPSTKN